MSFHLFVIDISRRFEVKMADVIRSSHWSKWLDGRHVGTGQNPSEHVPMGRGIGSARLSVCYNYDTLVMGSIVVGSIVVVYC